MFSFSPQQRQFALSLRDAVAAELSADNYLEGIHVGPLVVPFLPFKEAIKKIEDGFVWRHEPDLEKWGERGNQVISLKKGKELLLVEVQYDPKANKIFPPK